VAHYTFALLEALARVFPDDEWRVVVPRGAARVPAGVTIRHVDLPGRIVFGAAALTGRPRLDRLAGGGDVVWLPAVAPVAVSADVPLVLTVHDRSWEQRPGDFTRYERLWHRLARPRRLARRAARVLTTTAVGRRDLVATWGLDPHRVVAVPLAPAVGVAAAAREPAGDPYALFVGALEPRKGPDVLARAAARAGVRVIAVGEGRVPVPGLERVGRVAEAELSALYAGALAVVVPSWLEGFGLPGVEALAHGTPVIASDLQVLREVLGDAAVFVAPGDEAGLAAALRDLAERPRRADPASVAHLSWEATARTTRAVLADAAAP
jgi:glycosyltransferase involved in cell wall biosynthesis